MTRPNPLPEEGTQQWRVLMGLLSGDKITPISSIIEYNCFAINARCSELRKLGWPVVTLQVPHPNQTKFPNAQLPCYMFDAHFRRWMHERDPKTGKSKHPLDYPFNAGRGKFATKERQ